MKLFSMTVENLKIYARRLRSAYRFCVPNERLLFGSSFRRQWLQIATLRHFVALVRYLYLVWGCKNLRTFDPSSGAVATNTIWHNLKGLRDLSCARSNRLILPLCAIETYRTLAPINTLYDLDYVCEAKVLSVGPRTEGELLNLFARGFRPCNVRGLDLISYSPWIDLGDMHRMPYQDDSWDIVILSAVLAYSDDPARAAREVVRVVKNGGLVAVESEYDPHDNTFFLSQDGYIAGSEKRWDSASVLLELFQPHVGQLFFQHDLKALRPDQKSTASVIFSVNKP